MAAECKSSGARDGVAYPPSELRECEAELASSPCLIAQASDPYLGYADPSACAAFLARLLGAERAGVAACARLSVELETSGLRALADDSYIAGLKWCSLLEGELLRLGATRPTLAAACLRKVETTPDALGRARYLNRWEARLARRIRAFRPQVRDDRLHAVLSAIGEGHEVNAARTLRVLHHRSSLAEPRP